METINKTIELSMDFRDLRHCLAEAKREVKGLHLEPAVKHFLYYKAPINNDLVVIEFIRNKWQVRKCDDFEWISFFNNQYNKKIYARR